VIAGADLAPRGAWFHSWGGGRGPVRTAGVPPSAIPARVARLHQPSGSKAKRFSGIATSRDGERDHQRTRLNSASGSDRHDRVCVPRRI